MDKLSIIRNSITSIADYPKPGILFYDITTLLIDPKAFKATIELIAQHYQDKNINKIVGTESRGFIFGAPLALALNVPFVLVRKPNKLPRDVMRQPYSLEYGEDALEIHKDSINSDDNVLIIDDLLATGGTIDATAKLIRHLGGTVQHAGFVIELFDLKGRERLQKEGIESFSILTYNDK